MLRLRRAWLWAVGCALVIGGGSALVMRLELLDPEPTLTPELYNHALVLHGLVSSGVLLAALLAIPALALKPGRGSVVLGFLALALWAGAIAFLVVVELDGSQGLPAFAQRSVLIALAASLGLGAAQIIASMPATADRSSRPQRVAAVGALAAIAIVATPLVSGNLPTALGWLLATTAVASGLVYDATMRGARSFAVVTTVPCLLFAWAATVDVRFAPSDLYFHDTVAMLSPLPLTGAALLGALFAAATRLRSPHRFLAHVGAALMTAGATVTSLGFFLLGSRGLPRRYFAYLPEYQPLQVVIGAAAAVTVIGCVAALEAFRRGTPET
jgi:hypothetical protein